jgi:zinc/manganese transport system substrate-binding protein
LRKIVCGVIAFFIFSLFGCTRTAEIQKPTDTPAKIVEKEQYLKIMTTNKLLYYMVKDIVKDKHLVDYMLKTEEDQWNFKYTEDSLNSIGKKDLFIYLGASYEPWMNSFLEGLKKSRVGIVNVSRGVKLLSLSSGKKYLDVNKKEIELKENPYYWLSPDDYKIALSNITNSILEKDPKNREFYETNFNEAAKNIDQYSKDIKLAGDELKRYTFVIVEDDFDYFLRFLNMKTVKLDKSDLDPANKDKLEKKLGESKEFVMLFNKEENIKPYEAIRNKYSMKVVNIMTYKFDVNINDILKYNLNSLNNLKVNP